MKSVLFLLFFFSAVISTGCKKDDQEEPESPARNFKYLIVRDAIWKFHFQGKAVNDPDNPGFPFFDSSYHRFARVTATGRDTSILNRPCYVYEAIVDEFKGSTFVRTETCNLGVSEDTTGIYIHNYLEGAVLATPYLMVTFNDTVTYEYFDYRKNWVNTFKDGNITVGGVSLTKYSANIPGGGKCFFKAEGIGGPYGPFGTTAGLQGYGGYIISMDFLYKGDSLHFDY